MNDFPEYVLFVKQNKFIIKNLFKIVLFDYFLNEEYTN